MRLSWVFFICLAVIPDGCGLRTYWKLPPIDAGGSVAGGANDGGGASDGGTYDADASIVVAPATLLMGLVESSNPAVVTHEGGNATAVWSTTTGVDGVSQWMSQRDAMTGQWVPPTRVPFGFDAGSLKFSLGGDRYGNALIANAGPVTVDGGRRVRSVVYLADGGYFGQFSDPFVESTSDDVRVSVDSSGFAALVYASGSWLFLQYGAIDDFSASPSTGFELAQVIYAFDVAVNSSKEIFYVTQSSDNTVRGALYVDGGFNVRVLDNVVDSGAPEVRIAVGENQSSPVAVWRSQKPGESGKYVRASTWVPGQGFDFNTAQLFYVPPTDTLTDIRVAQSNAGNTLVVWMHNFGDGRTQLWGNFLPTSASWVGAIPFTANVAGVRQPAIVAATTPNGPSRTFWVAWTQFISTKDVVFLTRVFNGTPAVPLQVNDGGGTASSPALAALPDGGCVVVWIQEVAGYNSVFATTAY
ncbi:MAG: hypothetical protein HYY84_20555 [Deltaproteobacteria bacterium]|nr:hypothetical protein [Deltaproteobacteria bacterium]